MGTRRVPDPVRRLATNSLLALYASLIAIGYPCVTAAAQPSTRPDEMSIRRFFQAFNDRESASDTPARRADERKLTMFIVAFPPLHSSDTTAVVYLMSAEWCGTGGCTTFVLKKSGPEWQIVSRIPATRPPIYMLPENSHGWRDIAVLGCGGGIIKCYESDMPFDGKTYPLNSSMPPSHQMQSVRGTVIIKSRDQAVPLY